MDIDKIIPIFIVIGCIILFIIINTSKTQEKFKSEYRESDIILPNPVPTFQYELDEKKDLIISEKDKNNSYPKDKYVKKIDAPIVIDKSHDKDAAFEDVHFIRDKGVENAMKNKNKINDKDYIKVSDRINSFNYPINSKDLLTSVNINNLSKSQLDGTQISDLYNDMTSKVINDITTEQINSITGKTTEDPMIKIYYKPIYVSLDGNTDYIKQIEQEEAKYKYISI